MSTAEIQRLVRRFKIGAVTLDDPAPELAPEKAVQLFAVAYPFVTGATLSEPTVDGNALVYSLEKRPVQTKG